MGLSAIFSGLNVGLMSLDSSSLKRKAKLKNKAAKRILPLRQNAHLSLASILLANVAVISAPSLVLSSWLNGLVAGVLSTLLIVIFGEIVPQALFTRHALKLAALLAPLLKVTILITYPVSKPLQLLLDKLFGHQEEELESRGELGMLITQHAGHKASELDDDEVEIMRGALSLSEKRVRDIMTEIKNVYWLELDTELDSTKIEEIKAAAHSRIPILNPAKTKCCGLLLVRELIDIDFDERRWRIEDLPLHPTSLVGSMTALDTLFRKFISTHTHLFPVEKDDKIVGIVTIEDLLEEIIGHEIEDETDQRSGRLLFKPQARRILAKPNRPKKMPKLKP